jgi:hypothetical protein
MVQRRGPVLAPTQSQPRRSLDLGNTLVLVSCVKRKLKHSAPARALYTSAWFRKVRDIVEASGARWFVLSARYGLVAPDVGITPYEYTLNTLAVAERKDWATKVLGADYRHGPRLRILRRRSLDR